RRGGRAPPHAQSSPHWGRFTLFAQASRQDIGDETRDFRELISTLALHGGHPERSGLEYALEGRFISYPSSERDNVRSLYDAYLGYRAESGLGFRVGQMWLNELGALGSVGGAMLEWRQKRQGPLGRFRFGLFGGLEPEYYDAGYAEDVRKAGAYLALDGSAGRRHVLGYVQVRNQDVVERSVVTLSNFIPSGTTFFLYQALEYDLEGPGGNGDGGLNYFFGNVRWAPVRAFEVLATYHRGRSIDVRTISDDIINGRPVDPRQLEGLLFESVGARITVTPVKRLRVWGGYARDRNNRGEPAADRLNAGVSTNDLLGWGFDITANASRIDRAEAGSYTSWYVSLGKTFGSRVYVTADYTSALSVFRIQRSDDVIVETRPSNSRVSLSALINLSRVFSLQLGGERLDFDEGSEDRLLTGLTVRF
ncbi:MAG: hypothetical protein ACOY3Y_15640, partial [Acidobacteriota bacterium]